MPVPGVVGAGLLSVLQVLLGEYDLRKGHCTEDSLGYIPEGHTWLTLWVLFKERLAAELRLEDAAEEDG